MACIRQLCCYKVIGKGSTILLFFFDKFFFRSLYESSDSLDKKWFPFIMKYEKIFQEAKGCEWVSECCCLPASHIYDKLYKGVRNNEKRRYEMLSFPSGSWEVTHVNDVQSS